jgi:hypothetical protein
MPNHPSIALVFFANSNFGCSGSDSTAMRPLLPLQ